MLNVKSFCFWDPLKIIFLLFQPPCIVWRGDPGAQGVIHGVKVKLESDFQVQMW